MLRHFAKSAPGLDWFKLSFDWISGNRGVPVSLAPWRLPQNTSPEKGSSESLQITSSCGQQVSAMSVVRVDGVPIGDDSESSPRPRRALSAGNRRGPSPYPMTPVTHHAEIGLLPID